MPDFGFAAASLQSSEKFAPYSKVVLKTDDYDSSQVKTFTAGNDSGRTLEAVIPWASQEAADSILESIRGYAYQPISAKGVIVDPATELGDDITVGGVSGFIENQDITFGGILRADIVAPGEEQIDHEYQFIVKRDRKTSRAFGAVGGAIRKTQEGLRIATEALVADIGDVQAGLYAIASADDIKGFKEANTTLFAKIQDDKQLLQAGIDARVTSEEFGKYKEAVARTYATIENVNSELNLKADKKTVELLDGRVSTVETATAKLEASVDSVNSTLELKADKKTVETLDGRITTQETSTAELTARVTGAEARLALKAEKKEVDTIGNRVTTIESATADLTVAVGEAKSALELKAEKKTVERLGNRILTVETSTADLTAAVDDTKSALNLKAEKKTVEALDGRVTTVETATANLSASVDDVSAGLNLKAEKKTVEDLSGRVSVVETATAGLSARVGDAEASLELKASQSSVDGLSSSVASLSADVINLKGRVDLTGSLAVDGGYVKVTTGAGMWIQNGVISVGGSGTSSILHLSSNDIYTAGLKVGGDGLQINGHPYTPQEITSTTGQMIALGYT